MMIAVFRLGLRHYICDIALHNWCCRVILHNNHYDTTGVNSILLKCIMSLLTISSVVVRSYYYSDDYYYWYMTAVLLNCMSNWIIIACSIDCTYILPLLLLLGRSLHMYIYIPVLLYELESNMYM